MFNQNKTFVIAEAGINHNGDFNLAKKLVVAAKHAGANAIKFQAFKTEELIIEEAKKAAHFKGKKSVFEQLKSWELSQDEYAKLVAFARKQKIILFASVFDLKSLEMLEEISVPLYKISSADLNNIPLLEAVAKTKKPVIISTGMGNLDEIREAVEIFERPRKKSDKKRSRSNLGILHCISLYPPNPEEFHLEKIAILREHFPQHTIGYSDHSLDIFIPVSAVALGAKIIEKHITLDKNMPGPDQKSSADPKDFAKMVEQIRFAEKASIVSTTNHINKKSKKSQFMLVPREQKMKVVFRRSLVAALPIKKGTVITKEMIAIKRPSTGLPPNKIAKIIGKRAKQDLKKNALF